MDAVDASVVLLAETMTRKVELKGYQCINPKESVGQNVAVLTAGKTCSYEKMKLYEPNGTDKSRGVGMER